MGHASVCQRKLRDGVEAGVGVSNGGKALVWRWLGRPGPRRKIFMASPPFLLSFSMFLILDFECSSVIALFFNLPLLIQFSFCGSPLYFV